MPACTTAPNTRSALAAALAREEFQALTITAVNNITCTNSLDAGHRDGNKHASGGTTSSRSLPTHNNRFHPPHNHNTTASLHPRHRGGGLPTPPNSLSPTIHPIKHSISPAMASAPSPLHPIESDIELNAERERGRTSATANEGSSKAQQLLSSEALSGLDATSTITPTLLARHHLPDILLQNGPMAIRYVLGHLTQTVPGFSRIPPAKARRLVVAALEYRGGGGLRGDVVFEKVGWGRWEARRRGETSAATNWPASPRSTEFDDRMEEEADKMSLDGDDEPRTAANNAGKAPRATSGRERHGLAIYDGDEDDATDDEDWDSLGPEMLRVPSYAASFASRRNSHTSTSFAIGKPAPVPIPRATKRSVSAGLSSPHLHPSAAVARSVSYNGGILPFRHIYSSSLSSAGFLQQQQQQKQQQQQIQTRSPSCAQEREAVEALLSMGGM